MLVGERDWHKRVIVHVAAQLGQEMKNSLFIMRLL